MKVVIRDDVSAGLPGLLAHRTEKEAAIGDPLEWDPHPGKLYGTIRLQNTAPISDRATWPAVIAWFTKTVVAFKEAFAPRIAELDLP